MDAENTSDQRANESGGQGPQGCNMNGYLVRAVYEKMAVPVSLQETLAGAQRAAQHAALDEIADDSTGAFVAMEIMQFRGGKPVVSTRVELPDGLAPAMAY